MQKVHCVSYSTVHDFPGNLVAEQHRLRKKIVVGKYKWEKLYVNDGQEFDDYDHLATEFFVACNEKGQVVGTMRSGPTTIRYMLKDHFSMLAKQRMPHSRYIDEASRLVIDVEAMPTREERKPYIDALVLALIERGLQRGKVRYLGFMPPKIWQSTFIRAGCDIEPMDEPMLLPEVGYEVQAGWIPVNYAVRDKIRDVTGIWWPLLDFGKGEGPPSSTCNYSQAEFEYGT